MATVMRAALVLLVVLFARWFGALMRQTSACRQRRPANN